MAKKKKISDTLAQQRKARQDFLELKKMQSGEIEAGPKPSEIAIKPDTVSKKIENYWFHFKWHTIAAIFAVVSLAVLISQCCGRTSWDIHVVYFTYKPVISQQTDLIADYLKPYCEDINGDGEVNIKVINCSMPLDPTSPVRKEALENLVTQISAEPKSLLYITDSESVKYFEGKSFKDFFDNEQFLLGEDFYKATELENIGKLPEGLQISCRRVNDTAIEKSKEVGIVYKVSQKILAELQKK